MLGRRILMFLAPPVVKRHLRKVGEMERLLNGLKARMQSLETAVGRGIASPTYVESREVGFNGQVGRKEIFKQLVSAFRFQGIVETGTFIGDTTGYMATMSKLPVYTTELKMHFNLIAKKRLDEFNNIEFENLDSRQFIKKLANNSQLRKGTCFFYLDAHWYEDVPLTKEIQSVVTNWDRFIVMIDDFRVPWDEGYLYDRYSNGVELTIELIRPLLKMYDLAAYFPSKPSSEETGAKRGCIVLVRQGELADKLNTLSSLRMYRGL
jgi:hypothetical protein